MKYLALLRDSFREALDTKILYVTLGLSFLLIFILLSTSYRPVSVEEEAEHIVNTLNLNYSLEAMISGEPDKLDLTSFEESNEENPPWERDYKLVLMLSKSGQNARVNVEHVSTLRLVLIARYWYLNPRITEDETFIREKDALGKEDTIIGHRYAFTLTSKGSQIQKERDWPHEASILFGLIPMTAFRSSLTYSVYWIENILVNNVGGWVIVLIGIIVSSFFIPNMLQRGSLDLLLVKPISRSMLLLFKYLGGLTFVFLNSLIAIGGVWLALGIRTGIWAPGVLLTVFVLTFFFALLYAVSTLVGVISRNSIVCIFVTLGVWFLLFGIGTTHSVLQELKESPNFFAVGAGNRTSNTVSSGSSNDSLENITKVVSAIHTVLPRTDDMNHITTTMLSSQLLSEEEQRTRGFVPITARAAWETIAISLAYIAALLGLACWRFTRQDY